MPIVEISEKKAEFANLAALRRANVIARARCPAGARTIASPTNHTMKTTSISLLSGLALGIISMTAVAQEGGKRPEGGGPGGPGGPGNRPVPPLIAALDANHDGVIDASEIANASKALATLDKNGDGKLSTEEIRPARPPGEGEGGRPGGAPDGKGGPEGRKRGGPDGGKGGKPGDGKKPE